MRRRPTTALPLLLILASAQVVPGRAEPPPAPAPAAPPAARPAAPSSTSAPAFPCGPAIHLTSAQQLLAALTAKWPQPGSGLSPISVELIADADLIARGDTLAGPSYCTARCTHEPRRVNCTGRGDQPCRVPVRFRVNEPVRGVKVDGQELAHEGIKLQVKAGARFRLRQRVLEFHPETPYYDPIITVEPTCEVACRPGERRCPATGLCSPTEHDAYCLSCSGLTRPECACRSDEGQLKPEGTSCSFLAGDYFPSGTCKQGRCVTQ